MATAKSPFGRLRLFDEASWEGSLCQRCEPTDSSEQSDKTGPQEPEQQGTCSHPAEGKCLQSRRRGISGANRGPVVWGPGELTPPATRLGTRTSRTRPRFKAVIWQLFKSLLGLEYFEASRLVIPAGLRMIKCACVHPDSACIHFPRAGNGFG